jgi:hypothetical protein
MIAAMSRRKRHPVLEAWYQQLTSLGGKARAASLTPKQRTKIARDAGKALQASRTKEERRAAAKKAIAARWAKYRAERKTEK